MTVDQDVRQVVLLDVLGAVADADPDAQVNVQKNADMLDAKELVIPRVSVEHAMLVVVDNALLVDITVPQYLIMGITMVQLVDHVLLNVV